MSKVGKALKKTVKGIGSLLKSPSNNSKEVANAIKKQAEDERKAKEEIARKEAQEKEFRDRVEKDQKALDGQKAVGTSESSSADLATSGLNEVNSDFSNTLMEDDEKKRKDALSSFMSNRR